MTKRSRCGGVDSDAVTGAACYWAAMRVFLLSDLHLALANNVRLTMFGDHWRAHEAPMAAAWDATVGPEDLVLIPGDISWARAATSVGPDIEWLAARPGRKLLSPGNHDRWWRSRDRMRQILPDCCTPTGTKWQPFHGGMVASAIGMTAPTDRFFGDREKKKWPRRLAEVQRLCRRVAEARRELKSGFALLMVHYPPCDGFGNATEISDVIAGAGIDLCVYGHFHRPEEWQASWNGLRDGVTWALGSADALNFTPRCLGTVEAGRLLLHQGMTQPAGPPQVQEEAGE